MVTCPLKADIFSLIFCCSPNPVAKDTSIITTPMAMAIMAIFIIGAEMLLLCCFALIKRLAIKYSRFKTDL